jgi:hypothetical protein
MIDLLFDTKYRISDSSKSLQPHLRIEMGIEPTRYLINPVWQWIP